MIFSCFTNYFLIFIVHLTLQQIVSSTEHEKMGEFIREINSLQSNWQAEENKFTNLNMNELQKLTGLKLKSVEEHPRTYLDYNIETPVEIPDSFDSRTQWPQCKSISSIKDQSNCGSCWAVSAASAMSDRLCIASGFKIHVNLSAEELISCCSACSGEDPLGGCDGGYLTEAWKYWKVHGLVSGGDYGSKEGCQPYQIKPCKTCSEEADTPKCSKNKCTNRKYRVSYNRDIIKGKRYYAVPNDMTQIQIDILKNGPLTTGFKVYRDFFGYKSGVYRYTTGDLIGNHAVRIIGWGSEKGTPYWLVANSWARWWGENGLFKINRGSNECGFEENVFAGSSH